MKAGIFSMLTGSLIIVTALLGLLYTKDSFLILGLSAGFFLFIMGIYIHVAKLED